MVNTNPDDEKENVGGSAPKKIRSSDAVVPQKEEIILKTPEIKQERCNICRQYTDEALIYNGHPNKAVDEFIALTDEKLMLFNGNEEINNLDVRPTNKVSLHYYLGSFLNKKYSV